MEEVDLRWIQTGWTSWDGVVDGRDGSDSGFSWDLVGFDLLFKSVNWSITENKCDLILEDRSQDVEFWDFSAELFEMFELIVVNTIDSESEDFLDQGLNYCF